MSRLGQNQDRCLIRRDIGDSREAEMDNPAWGEGVEPGEETDEFLDVLQGQ